MTLCIDTLRVTIIAIAACSTLLIPSTWGQVRSIAGAGVAGLFLFKTAQIDAPDALPSKISERAGAVWLQLFVLACAEQAGSKPNYTDDRCVLPHRLAGVRRGHVVLPLLQAEVVPTGGGGNEAFLAGYGATQVVPGPLFTFAAFLGASFD